MPRGALFVGINNYEGYLQDLNSSVHDANSVAELLLRNGDDSRNFHCKVNTTIRTSHELRDSIRTLFNKNLHTALFYFSGHGGSRESGGFLATPDSRNENDGVPMDEILNIVNRSPIQDKIVILDCCNAGAYGDPALLDGKLLLREGITILAASRANESAMEVNGHSVFTNLFLTALKGAAADINGKVTTASAYAFIDRSLGFWHQRPVFKSNVPRFSELREVPPVINEPDIRQVGTLFKGPAEEYTFNHTHFCSIYNSSREYSEKMDRLLKKLELAGLVSTTDIKMPKLQKLNKHSFRLTPLGVHYWHMVERKKI